eukprot:302603-Pleurochrysis_carterae.AAC.8
MDTFRTFLKPLQSGTNDWYVARSAGFVSTPCRWASSAASISLGSSSPAGAWICGRRLGRPSAGRCRRVEICIFLLKQYAIGIGGDVDIEQVRHGPFILHVPPRRQGSGEGGVQGIGRVVRIQHEEVVDVAPKYDRLGRRFDVPVAHEDAGVGTGLSEAPIFKPREQGPLPPAPGLRHAIH